MLSTLESMRALKRVIDDAYECRADIERLVEKCEFEPDDWKWLMENHRAFGWELMNIMDKYGEDYNS